MTKPYTPEANDQLYYLTWTVVDWIDVFSRKTYKDLLIESLAYCIKQKGLKLHAYVIMTNHMHLIASAQESARLSDITRDFKKHTTKEIIKAIQEGNESRKRWLLQSFLQAGSFNTNNEQYQLWQNGSHAICLESTDWIDQKLDYIHNNPVRSGKVFEPHHYVYSSALDYAGEKGLLPLDMLR